MTASKKHLISKFIRLADLVPQEPLQALTITIIGEGAIGRQVVLQLPDFDAAHRYIIDFDRVYATNLATQSDRYLDHRLASTSAISGRSHLLLRRFYSKPCSDLACRNEWLIPDELTALASRWQRETIS